MYLDFLIFILFYFLAINSTIGYGYLIAHISKINFKFFDISFLGLLGIFVLLLLSYISHLFFSHNYMHNSLILIVGISSVIYFFLKKKNNNLIKLNIFFLLIFISFIIFKSHDDFSYYHFPYTYYLTQTEIVLGIGNFNHGFRTPSSIFYLNSLFYLPFIKYHLFHIGAIMVMGFSCYHFLDLINNGLNKKKYDKFFFLSLFFFVFTVIFFYRVAEHGTDRSAQILIFILIIKLLRIINFNIGIKENIVEILIILGLVISLKAFYVLYLVFCLPVFYYFIKDKKLNNLILIFKSYFFYLFLLLIINVIFVNYVNTGCLIYPLSITCFEFFDWSIPLKEVSLMNDWYEQWSKAGANPNFRVENPEHYIQNFNWVNNWFEKYFFTKVSDFLFGLFILILVFLVMFRSKRKKLPLVYKGERFIYIIVIILFFEWFYNHPALRYGGYQLICLLIFLPISSILSRKSNLKNVIFKTKILLLIAMTIFFSRNINRLINENSQYAFKPLINPFYRITINHFSIQNKFREIVNNKLFCSSDKTQCVDNLGINVKEKNGYKIFYREKN